MTPLDFINLQRLPYNDAVGDMARALQTPIQILSGPDQEWEILSYYLDARHERMILDIQPIEKKKVKKNVSAPLPDCHCPSCRNIRKRQSGIHNRG